MALDVGGSVPPLPVRFILDTNVFIEARGRYYAFDICPAFWHWLAAHGDVGDVASVDRVKSELAHGSELQVWARTMPAAFFRSTNDPTVQLHVQQLMQWAAAPPYPTHAAKADFASKADASVIAYAMATGATVVTLERPAPESRTVIKIPDACLAFGVPVVNTFAMLRVLGARFDLATT